VHLVGIIHQNIITMHGPINVKKKINSITFLTSCLFYVFRMTIVILLLLSPYTGCPTRYRTRYFFNNFTTNEDISKRI